jgi:hypothetical protein
MSPGSQLSRKYSGPFGSGHYVSKGTRGWFYREHFMEVRKEALTDNPPHSRTSKLRDKVVSWPQTTAWSLLSALLGGPWNQPTTAKKLTKAEL